MIYHISIYDMNLELFAIIFSFIYFLYIFYILPLAKQKEKIIN